jgi:hypothetical protein
MLKAFFKTCVAVFCASVALTALAQNFDPRVGAVNVSITPVDASVQGSLSIRQIMTPVPGTLPRDSSSAGGQGLQSATLGDTSGAGPSTSNSRSASASGSQKTAAHGGSSPGGVSGSTQGAGSATASVWGPQVSAAVAASFGSSWTAGTPQSSVCNPQSGGRNEGDAGTTQSNTAAANNSAITNPNVNCQQGAAVLDQLSMQAQATNSKGAHPGTSTPTSASSRLASIRLQMANSSVNGILNYRSKGPDASASGFSNSPSGAPEPRNSERSASSTSAASKRSAFETAESSGVPHTASLRMMHAMRRAGLHPKSRHGGSPDQQSPEHCAESGTRVVADNSSSEQCGDPFKTPVKSPALAIKKPLDQLLNQ